MNKFIISISAVSLFAFSCGSDQQSGQTDLAPASFDSLISASANEQLVDVRTLEEYQSGHIDGALNYDWNDATFTDNVNELDKSKPVLVYCRSGNRSSNAADYLRSNGFTQVYELDGGISAWEAAGKPVSRPDESTVVTTTAPSKGTAHAGPVSVDQYNKIIAENKVVLVDFTATWCGPCKMLAPSLHELETEMADKFILLTVDVDRDRPVAEQLNIMAMPTLVLYKEGQVQWRNEGVVPKNMIADKINSVQ